MSARKVLVISTLLIMCLAPFQTALSSSLESNSHNETGGGPGPGQGPPEILLMGNSYVSSNSLHNLLSGVMSEASTPANVSSLNGGGMRLSQHASNVATSGHQWNTTLNNGAWDWVVLQDQSQIPGFVRNQQEWIDSKDGAVELAEIIEDNGGKTILMMTWGRRAGDSVNTQRFPDFSTMQDELASGYLDYRDNITANGDKAWVAPVGLAFEHIHDKVVAEGGTPTTSGNTFYDLYSNDGSHPSLSGSYLSACVLYATITGDDPVGLSHSTSLSNALVLELQQAAAATVFNETSHLDYPWQNINSGGGQGNQNNNLSPFPENLAPEWVKSIGNSGEMDWVSDVQISSKGEVFVMGTSMGQGMNAGTCYNPNGATHSSGNLFIAKFDRNGTCLWLSLATSHGKFAYTSDESWTRGSFTIDSNDNVYIYTNVGDMPPITDARSTFGNHTVYSNAGATDGILAKMNTNGTWIWATGIGGYSAWHNIEIDSNNDIWIWNIGSGDTFLEKYDTSGNFISSIELSQNGDLMDVTDFVLDRSDNFLLTGSFLHSFTCTNGPSSQSFSVSEHTPFVMKINSQGDCLWFTKTTANSNSYSYSIEIDSNSNSYITGHFYANLTFGQYTIRTGGIQNGFVAKINSTGVWQWAKQIDCSCTTEGNSVIVDQDDNMYVTGSFNSGLTTLGSVSFLPAGGAKDVFLVKMNDSGNSLWSIEGGGNSDDRGYKLAIDNGGRILIFGSMDSTSTFETLTANDLGSTTSSDLFLLSLSTDYDIDGNPDVNDIDDDGDFVHDPFDSCHYSPLGFKSTSNYDHDSDGCHDDLEDDDDDNDMLNDTLDNCPKGMTGWIRTNSSDFDDDGCMDTLEDYDDDNDGIDDYEDYCSRIPGNSTMEFEKGCPDTDGDGRPDILDPFPNDSSEWKDTDGDGVGDNSDAFYLDATQQYDTDGDTYGDEEFGNAGDSCPTVYGNSTIDRYGCLDTDGDGWSDAGDDFPNDPSEYLDTDGDNVPNHLDEFPFDPTQQTDSDGDGYGDNANGNLGDSFPNDPTRHSDSDRDGVDDDSDAFPYDPTQTVDSDGDGMGDNPMGIGADKFPDDPTQWGDIDGDGYGDNQTGNNPDAFPTDATQWSDRDGDGFGDNPAGRLYDLFPDNPTQWLDEDEDGLGDNQSGTDADPYLNDRDNDGYNDTIDILPRVYSPGDLDADGCMDEVDAFINNSLECIDTDGDGIGNNADSDDDNDGWTDAAEERLKTDSLNSNEKPVDSFEIQIGNIGLGAWDLIGMFGGIPIFSWILFGFVTRNARCARYEEQLEEANSRQELEQVALRWEYSLMLRLLGPHQGIRLERIRAELDDRFENAENLMLSEDFEPMTEIDQTFIVDEQEIPAIGSAPDKSMVADQIDSDGYEWIDHGGQKWYRVTNSQEEWQKFS